MLKKLFAVFAVPHVAVGRAVGVERSERRGIHAQVDGIFFHVIHDFHAVAPVIFQSFPNSEHSEYTIVSRFVAPISTISASFIASISPFAIESCSRSLRRTFSTIPVSASDTTM